MMVYSGISSSQKLSMAGASIISGIANIEIRKKEKRHPRYISLCISSKFPAA